MTAQVNEPGLPAGPRFDKARCQRPQIPAAPQNAVQEGDCTFRPQPSHAIDRHLDNSVFLHVC
jgi:hypothetical protein